MRIEQYILCAFLFNFRGYFRRAFITNLQILTL